MELKNLTFFKSRLKGEVKLPPSKSLAHRAIICAALAAYVIFGSVGSREVATVEETADSRINVRAEQVYPETFRNFTRLNGEIGSNNSDIAIVPDTSGNVASATFTVSANTASWSATSCNCW